MSDLPVFVEVGEVTGISEKTQRFRRTGRSRPMFDFVLARGFRGMVFGLENVLLSRTPVEARRRTRRAPSSSIGP
jgi:hypothetical protein